MSTEPFTDEILSAIIDGEADEATVASVEADPAASARLAQLRHAVAYVATPVPEASPERRSASLAAAMAAATPAPEVTSLAAARHERTVQQTKATPQRGRWLAAVAAAILLVVAIPVLVRLGGSESLETAADTSSDDSGSASFDVAADATDDTASEDGATAETVDALENEEVSAAMADEPDFSADASEEDTMEEEAAADEPNTAEEPADQTPDLGIVAANRLAAAPLVSNLEILEEFVTFGTIEPVLTIGQLIDVGVSPACVDLLAAELSSDAVDDAFFDTPLFDIAFLDEDGTDEPRLLVIQFNEDGTMTPLDAEDCSRLG